MKSKKNLFLIVLALATLGLIGGFLYIKSTKNYSSFDSLNKLTDNKNSNGLFESIKDALSKDLTLSCDFNDGNSQVKSYIKNGSVRVSTVSDNNSGEMIMANDKMYIWDIKTKQGFVYDIPKSENGTNQEIGMTGQEVVSSEGYLDLIDKYKDSCKVATVEDSFFVAPSDIEFQDMAKMLEDLQKYQMPQIPNGN